MKPTPFQIYAKLPKTNCHDCGFPTCLALATQVFAYGPADLGKCPHLEATVIDELAALFPAEQTTSRDSMIGLWNDCRGKLGSIDWARLATADGVEPLAGGVSFLMLGRRVEATVQDIRFADDPDALTEHDKILVFYFLEHGADLTGRYELNEYRALYAKLKVRDTQQESFEIHLQEAVGANTERLRLVLASFGGTVYGEYADLYEVSMLIHLFPRVPVLILFRPSDDEYPAYAKMMFDKGSDICFDVEGLEHLADYVVEQIAKKMGESVNG